MKRDSGAVIRAVLVVAAVLILALHSKLRELAEADEFVQSLNDQYASPSGTTDTKSR